MLLRRPHHHQPYRSSATALSASTALFGKKKTPGPNHSNKRGGGGGGQPRQEKASVKEARFDAATRQFMFTLAGLTKTLPDKSKDILKNIHLSFYPGAKIGVVGLNGSGKVRTSSRQFVASGAFVREGGVCVRFFFAVENTSLSCPRPAIIILQSTLLKIMAGIEKEFDGIARPLPGASIGYLSQEPVLQYETVRECIDRAILDRYNELSESMANPDITDEEMTKAMEDMERIGNKIEAENLWELDRTVERAMDSLRVPPGDARTAVLSGGEKRRVSLCQLLLENHDMLLLDEVRVCVCHCSFLFLSPAGLIFISSPSYIPTAPRNTPAAHEPPRRREHLLARAIPRSVQRHRRVHHPRSLLLGKRGTVDTRARSRAGHTLRGELLPVARGQEQALGGGEEERDRRRKGRVRRARVGEVQSEGEGHEE